MIIPLGIALIGLILIYLEFFIPGAILGAVGILFLVSSLIMLGMSPLPLTYFFVFLVVLGALVVLTLKLGLNRTKKVISLRGDQAGFVASSFEHTLIGKTGIVLSDLKPSGHIQIENTPYQAISESLYIVKGTSIVVVGGRGSYLIVKEVSL